MIRIVAVHSPLFSAAEFVPVRVVVEGTGLVRIGTRRFFVWKKLERYVEVARGTVIAGHRIDPAPIPTAATPPNARIETVRAQVEVGRFNAPGLVVDLGET